MFAAIAVPEQSVDVHHGDADNLEVPTDTDPQEKVGQCSEQAIRDLGE